MLTLSACIVVYNGCDEALKAAASVLQHTQKYPLTLYLVDNASPDGSAAQLQQALDAGALSAGQGQAVRLLCRQTNGGFGTGHNMVLSLLESQYHFILNPDILLESDVLSGMADYAQQHPEVVMARPGLRYPDGRVQELPLRKCSLLALVYRQLPFLKCLKPFNDRYVMAGQDLSVPTDIEFCTGSFSMLRTEVFRAIGGFDEGYFMYVEDADLTQKALQKGRVQLWPQFTAVHAWHRAPHSSLRPFVLQMKSMARYFAKWGLQL